MTKIFKFDEDAKCPECGKSLDDAPARDFIVWGRDKQPTEQVSDNDCGWCDAMLTAQWIVGTDTIEFRNKY